MLLHVLKDDKKGYYSVLQFINLDPPYSLPLIKNSFTLPDPISAPPCSKFVVICKCKHTQNLDGH